MELNERQKEYIKRYLGINLGADTTISKEDIVRFAEDIGLQFKKNISKSSLVELILSSGYEEQFFNTFAEFINVPYWELHKQYNISYKQISDLEQLGVIKALDFKGKRDTTLYPIESLRFQDGELLQTWNDKYRTDFFRTRIEIKKIEEFHKLVNELSKIFEIENVSKPYEHREQQGYYCYLSIRPLNGQTNNDNYKNEENARLKAEIGSLQSQIEKLQETISGFEKSATESFMKSPRYETMIQQLKEYQEFYLIHKYSDEKIERLEERIKELTGKQSEKHPGGRPPKLSEQDKTMVQMYRLQGKTIKDLAEMFGCSVGAIHKIVSEKSPK